jgi:hypothetical protein
VLLMQQQVLVVGGLANSNMPVAEAAF